MNLNAIRAIKRPLTADEITGWASGDAWLAGGTWLFSEPQPSLETLIDLEQLGWPALALSDGGLDIAATCSIATLYGFNPPVQWGAAALIKECANCLLASFKIWNAATVGGNICMSLPAGAMISLTVALEATYELWQRDGTQREIPALDFVTGNHANVLKPGELLRSIHIPARSLSKRFALRHASLTKLGRSAALIVGTQTGGTGDMLLTITAATPRPVQIAFPAVPTSIELRRAIDAAIPGDGYFADPHGSAPYKHHLTYHFAEQIRQELAQPAVLA
ncbi:FAD binding domain-containing protein [Microvirga antarctica]|uniref:FAD binding domain-containing protein n=1 Tax=Microvirga antarctica TaxID=2819233 RepID=UPI001B311598|nr:FAD binding domain-containing protein [Microvirga antarctica]